MDFQVDAAATLEAGEARKSLSGAPSKKPTGTFQSMGLCRPLLKAIERKGYKLATPIQRKCIPAIMSGRDMVAMARTGSGKTAAFLLPLIDRLKIRQPKADIRALILSPTRELATQTYKFVREFTKFTNLISKLVIGGESMSRDFETITSCPDILVATPGRLVHVLVEMKHKLDGLEIVVFDEADRLFETGFKEAEQVNEICQRMPDSKQTLLFSATIPQRLADFAKAGLNNPLFVRLDVESNLSETLKTIHLHCNQQDKFAILVHLLKCFTKQRDKSVVVFMPTKHHVEYANMLMENARIKCSYVFSSMDPEARKINVERFKKKQCKVMLVTDIAARGIDIPLLDVVINFNFPFKPKLFIHRVGRVARAGRSGCAISLISHDETPYLHALHIFFGLPIVLASQLTPEEASTKELDGIADKVIGAVPRAILDDENDVLNKWHQHNEDLKAMVRVCDNAMKPFLKTREPPAPFSVKAAKDIHKKTIGIHPLFSIISSSDLSSIDDLKSAADEVNMLDMIKAYKPQATIFEVGHIKGNRRAEAYEVMQKKRKFHDKATGKRTASEFEDEEDGDVESSNENDAQVVNAPIEPIIKKSFEDSKFYLKYQPDGFAREKGLELDKNSFNNDLRRNTLDLVADDEDKMKSQRHQMVWDRKRKKYVKAESLNEDGKKTKKIRTESGAYISSSYQSGLFEKWKKQSKFEQKLSDADDDDDSDAGGAGGSSNRAQNSGNKDKSGGRQQRRKISLDKLQSKLKPARARRELKNTDEMLKERTVKEKREAILRLKTQRKAQRNQRKGASGGKPSGGGGKPSGGKSPGGKRSGGKAFGGRASGGKSSGGGKAKGNPRGGHQKRQSSGTANKKPMMNRRRK